jgi:glycosyltransferase involved in cell wall biosynthesis
MAKVLHIPSWYPSPEHPTAGVFIRQQILAVQGFVDNAVLFAAGPGESHAVRICTEDGMPVARVLIKGLPAPATAAGRTRARTMVLPHVLCSYPRAGMAAFETLREVWGTPDIVHVQALWPAGLIARAIKRRYGIPYVVTEHSEEYLAASKRRLVRTPGMVPLVLRPLARGASRTIAVSQFLADRLLELRLAVDPVVIPNAIPVTSPAPMPSAERHAIAHVSIMGPAKNLGMLLQAVDQLRRRRTDFVLRLIGDGELRAALEQTAAARDLGEIVRFTGRVSPDRVLSLLVDSVFSVVSSTHETFSVVAAESLMCGRPVLSTRCGGPEEFITPEVGRLVEADSVDALVEGLDWMLDHFHEFRPDQLHEYAVTRFAPDVVAQQILDVYQRVLDGR